MTGGFGLNNIGLLVTLSGRPAYIDSHSFTLDDGSGIGVHCVTPETVTVSPLWQHVTVTGISSLENVDSQLRRKLLVRDEGDIRVVVP